MMAATHDLVDVHVSKWDIYHKSVCPWENGEGDSHLRRWLISNMEKGGTAIDLGCGKGYNSDMIRRLGTGYTRVLGVDISHTAIEACRTIWPHAVLLSDASDFLLATEVPSLSFLEADVLKLKTLNGKFSLVYDCQFFHAIVKEYESNEVAVSIASLLEPVRNIMLIIF
jgi:SAM-dependent methyltransferase